MVKVLSARHAQHALGITQKPVTYSWTSGLVTQTLDRRGYGVRIIIEGKGLRVDAWYSDRIAHWAFTQLAAAQQMPAATLDTYTVRLAGPAWSQPLGDFGYFDKDKLGDLLWGLYSYHCKLRRAAVREQMRQQRLSDTAGCLALLTGHYRTQNELRKMA